MIILYDYSKQGDPNCFCTYLPKLQEDVNKNIWMPANDDLYSIYGEDKYKAYVNNALNMSRHKKAIVLIPAIAFICDILREYGELKNCYFIGQPNDLLENEFCESVKDYVIDFAYYNKFATHVEEFIREEHYEFKKWFMFNHHLF